MTSDEPGTNEPGTNEPDIRFSLANERTFLAYERTAIGLVAAALAVFQLFEPGVVQRLLGAALVLTGVIAAGGGWVRYRQAERAIRDGGNIQSSPVVHVMALAVLACIVVAALSVVLA